MWVPYAHGICLRFFCRYLILQNIHFDTLYGMFFAKYIVIRLLPPTG
jgi:hypothetical protein